MRLRLAIVLLAGAGCGKQLNADFCDAHPADDRCMGESVDVLLDGGRGDAETCPIRYTVTFGMTSRYRVVDDVVSWEAAEADCADDGTTTHLVVLNNDAERLALTPYATAERHIGYTDTRSEGTWIPITNDPDVYADLVALSSPPWNGGEPNEGTSGNCLALSTNLDFRDRSCASQAAAYVCECDHLAPNPANF